MKASIQKLFPANSFARGVAVLASGTAGAQILLLLAAPIMTRLYSPEDFGVLAVFVSILSILGVTASLRYELAIPIAEDEQTALNVVVLCLLITTGMAILTAIAVLFAGSRVANQLGICDFVSYFWLLPVGIFFIGVYQTFNHWATREKAFGRISTTKLAQSISSLIVQLSLFKLGPLGLLTGYIMGQFLGAGKLAISAIRKLAKQSISFEGLQASATRYRRFPQISSWDALLNVSSLHIFPITLAAMFGISSLGLVALANRIVHLPIAFISTSVSRVTYAYLTSMTTDEQKNFISKLNLFLSYAITPLTIVLIFFGEDIFTVIFGDKWREAGVYVGWIAVWTHFQFISSPVSNIFLILEEQGKLLSFQLFLFVSRFVAVLFCFVFESGVVVVVACYSLVSALLYFFLTLWIYRVIRVDLIKTIQVFVPLLIAALVLSPFYFEFSWYTKLAITPVSVILVLFYFKKMVRLFKRVSYRDVKS